MKAALARRSNSADDAQEAARPVHSATIHSAHPLGTRCSSCGEVIRAPGHPVTSTLLELQCSRCGTNDVYHVNCLRPLAAVMSARDN